MTIAIALLGNNCGLVASDSQTVDLNGNINNQNFDKTFYLLDRRVAVAQAGLIEHNGTYINDVISNSFIGIKTPTKLSQVINIIRLNLESWLNANSQNIVAIDKDVNLLIVGREYVKKGVFQLFRIEFKYDSNNNPPYSNEIFQHFGGNSKALAGDNNAQISILNSNYPNFATYNKANLRTLANALINTGIQNCGLVIGFPQTPSCGGVFMHKSV